MYPMIPTQLGVKTSDHLPPLANHDFSHVLGGGWTKVRSRRGRRGNVIRGEGSDDLDGYGFLCLRGITVPIW